MNTIQLIDKAMEILKTNEGWYRFKDMFWPTIEDKNLKLLTTARKCLSFLHHEIKDEILTMCKHEDITKYDNLEICLTCEASRHRDKEDYYGYISYTEWTSWNF